MIPSNYKKLRDHYLDSELFVDLLFTSKKILDLTTSNDILVLIGESPAYLGPVLKHHRKILYLPMTDKPFSCYWNKNYILEKRMKEFYIPTQKGLDTYFNYLNTETILTKAFAKDNWDNIVGIDTSGGMSANGTSIFLNKYAGNMKADTKCDNIKTAKPLRFINLKRDGCIRLYNDSLVNAKHILFYHVTDFIYSLYERFVPSYRVREWENKLMKYVPNGSEGIWTFNHQENLWMKKQIYDLYENFKTNKPKLLKWLKTNCKNTDLANLLKKETDLDKVITIIFNHIIEKHEIDEKIKEQMQITTKKIDENRERDEKIE